MATWKGEFVWYIFRWSCPPCNSYHCENQQYNVEFVNDKATNVAKHLAAGIVVEFGNNDFHKF